MRSRAMRTPWLLATFAGAALSWAACSSFGGEDGAETSDGGGETQPDGFTSPPDVGMVDGGPVLDARVAVDGALIDDGFELGATCDSWTNGLGATALPAAGGHSGARACLVCANGPGGGMSKRVLSREGGAGTYQALAFLRMPDVDAGVPVSLGIVARDTAQNVTATANGYRTPGAAWQTIQAVLGNAPATTITVDVYFEIGDLTACVLIDDVSLTHE